MKQEYINRLGKEKRERMCQIINKVVIVREAFLKHGFSTEILCKEQNFNRQDLSAVMALYYGENFSSFLQRLRVNKACQMLTDPRYASKSCEAIGLRCGFSSRQSFYNAFLRIKGITPKDYRNEHKNNNA